MKKRSVIALLTACVLTLSAIAGCSTAAAPEEATEETTGQTTGGETAPAVESPGGGEPAPADLSDGGTEYMTGAGVLPIVREGNDITLSMFVALYGTVTDYSYEANDFTRYLTDTTGVKLEFETAPGSDADAKLNLLISSGDYPDIINHAESQSNLIGWSQQGMLANLNEPIDKYAVNLKAAMEADPVIKMYISDLNGDIYAVPDVNMCLHCDVANGRYFYYAPFQQALGLKEPTTLDEFTDNLRAIRDGDPNGNGLADEIPLAFDSGNVVNFKRVVANSFMPLNTADGVNSLTVVDGEVVLQYMNPKYKDALEYMKLLYDEKLFNQDAFTITNEELKSLGEASDALIGWQACAWHDMPYIKSGESLRWAQSFPIRGLKGPDGIGYTTHVGAYGGRSIGMYITDACEYPDVAVRLADWMYETEPTMNGYIGPKGEYWDDADEGTLGLNGEPALYKILQAYGTQRENAGWDSRNPMIRTADFRLGEQAMGVEDIHKFFETKTAEDAALAQSYTSYNEVMNYEFAKIELETALPAEYQLPPLLFDEATSQRIAEITAILIPYIDQNHAMFITGERSLDEFDAFVDEMIAMGAQEYTDIYNARFAESYPDLAK